MGIFVDIPDGAAVELYTRPDGLLAADLRIPARQD